MTYDPVISTSQGRTACETERNYPKYPLTVTQTLVLYIYACEHLRLENLFFRKNRQCTILLDSIKQEGQADLLSHANVGGGHLGEKTHFIECNGLRRVPNAAL